MSAAERQPDALGDFIVALRTGTLTDAAEAAFADRLLRDAELRRAYLDELELHGLLRWELGGPIASSVSVHVASPPRPIGPCVRTIATRARCCGARICRPVRKACRRPIRSMAASSSSSRLRQVRDCSRLASADQHLHVVPAPLPPRRQVDPKVRPLAAQVRVAAAAAVVQRPPLVRTSLTPCRRSRG